jgi:hypothetical protein
MRYRLHNPVNQAHLQELGDRLAAHLAGALPDPHNPATPRALVDTLTELVRAMDRGVIPAENVRTIFEQFRVPGFSFDRWLAEMVEEGVYLDRAMARAA